MQWPQITVYYLEDTTMWANYYLLLTHFHESEGSQYLHDIYAERALSKLIQLGEFSDGTINLL